MLPLDPDLVNDSPYPDGGWIVELLEVTRCRVHLVQDRHSEHLLEPLGGRTGAHPQDQDQAVVEEVRAALPETLIGGAHDGRQTFVTQCRGVEAEGGRRVREGSYCSWC